VSLRCCYKRIFWGVMQALSAAIHGKKTGHRTASS
jgi:hypothetical protein